MRELIESIRAELQNIEKSDGNPADMGLAYSNICKSSMFAQMVIARAIDDSQQYKEIIADNLVDMITSAIVEEAETMCNNVKSAKPPTIN